MLVDELLPGDFYTEATRTVHGAITRLHRAAGQSFDLLTLGSSSRPAAEFIDSHELQVMPIEQYEGALDRLRQLAEAREMARCFAELYVSGTSGSASTDPGEFLQNASQRLTAALEARRTKVRARTYGEVMRPIVETLVSGQAYTPRLVAPSGLRALDQRMVWRGFASGELTVVIGRPGMGKTTFGMHVARHNAVAGLHTVVFSFETSDEDLGLTVLTQEAGLPLSKLTGQVAPEDAARAAKHFGLTESIPLHIVDRAGLKFEDFVLECRAMKRRGTLDLIVVDYLQKLRMRQRYNARHEEIGDIASGLKQLARELDVPIVALAQPNREADKRADKRPTMADIGQSGQIEQDADRIIGLYRECQYDANADKSAAEALLLKNRKGVVGMVRLRFEGATGTFSDWGQS